MPAKRQQLATTHPRRQRKRRYRKDRAAACGFQYHFDLRGCQNCHLLVRNAGRDHARCDILLNDVPAGCVAKRTVQGTMNVTHCARSQIRVAEQSAVKPT